MSVGAVLLQPERVERATDADDSPIADLVGLVRVLVDEGRAGGPHGRDVEAAMAALADRLVLEVSGGLEAAADRLMGLLDPVLARLDVHVGALGSIEDADDLARELVALLDDLLAALEAVDPDRVGATLRTVLDAVLDDLGLSVDGVRADLVDTIRDLAATLQAPRADLDAAARRRGRDLARLLARLARRIETVELPAVDVDGFVREVTGAVRGVDLGGVLHDLRCAAQAIGAAVEAGTSLSGVVSASFGAGTVGAAAAASPAQDQHLYYATWLLGRKQGFFAELLRALAPWLPDDEVWIEPGPNGPHVVRRDVFGADREVAADADWTRGHAFRGDATPAQLEALDLDAPYTFGAPDDLVDLEQVAWVSTIVVHAMESFLHLLSLEEGDHATNAVLAVETAILATMDATTRAPVPWYGDTLLMRTVIPLVTSLEGMHTRSSGTNRFAMWLTLAGPDLAEMVGYRASLNALRDVVLSFLTLRNHQPRTTAGAPQPSNRLESAGMVAPFVNLFTMLGRLLIPKEHYGIERLKRGEVLGVWLAATPIFSLFGLVAGHLVTEFGVSGSRDFVAFRQRILPTLVRELVVFPFSYWQDRDGITDGGHFNPTGADFSGYPDAESSPYRLPWTSGTSIYVGQANQGFWSHSNENGEVYAYDFSMDQDEVVRAARAGTFWSANEATANDTTGRANRIVIRHDTVDNDHDRGPGGVVTTTWAGYLHGRTNSVSEAFGGSLPAQGTPIARGQAIMKAGDTGKSFHNHLHMEVYPDDGTGNPDTSTTIPFAFHEVGSRPAEKVALVLGLVGQPENLVRVIGRFRNPAGVPVRFNFYTSENT